MKKFLITALAMSSMCFGITLERAYEKISDRLDNLYELVYDCNPSRRHEMYIYFQEDIEFFQYLKRLVEDKIDFE